MNQNTGYPYSVTLRRAKASRSGYYAYYPKSPYDIEHHGTKGQKHGIRLYQNKDGSLTPLGRIHYGIGPARDSKIIEADNARRAEKRAERQAARAERKAEKQANMERIAAEKKAKEDAIVAEKADMDNRVERAKKNALMRAHPEWMSDEELKSDLERARLESQREEVLRNLNRSQVENTKFESSKKHKDYLSKSMKDMTNDELREATERIIAEKKYEDAVRELKQQRHPFAKQLLKDAANTMVRTIAQKGAEKLANKLFEDRSEVAKLKKLKEELELRKRVSDLEGKSGSDIVKRMVEGGFEGPDKEIERRKRETESEIRKNEDKLAKIREDRERQFEAFSKKKSEQLEDINKNKEALVKELSDETDKYNKLIKDAHRRGDYAAAAEYREKMSKMQLKAHNTIDNYEKAYSKLSGREVNKSVAKADKELAKIENEIKRGSKLLSDIEKEASDKAKSSSFKGDAKTLFKGMSAADVETAKNLLIDMRQSMYLANEIMNGGSGRDVDPGSFNFTNRFGGNSSSNNQQNQGKKKK